MSFVWSRHSSPVGWFFRLPSLSVSFSDALSPLWSFWEEKERKLKDVKMRREEVKCGSCECDEHGELMMKSQRTESAAGH